MLGSFPTFPQASTVNAVYIFTFSDVVRADIMKGSQGGFGDTICEVVGTFQAGDVYAGVDGFCQHVLVVGLVDGVQPLVWAQMMVVTCVQHRSGRDSPHHKPILCARYGFLEWQMACLRALHRLGSLVWSYTFVFRCRAYHLGLGGGIYGCH